jgi:serine/threonine-protein kinase OSR1/STK39
MHSLSALHTAGVQDPTKRPTSKELLEHKFFPRHIPKDRDYMRKHLIKGLPNVIERVRQMREGVAGMSCDLAGEAEATSNEEYVKGLSAWNFDVKELKRQVCHVWEAGPRVRHSLRSMHG